MQGKENRGTALRRAATEVAYEQGLAGLTLANVAQAAQMPLGSLYYYFKTRDDVVEAVVQGLEERMVEWVARLDALPGPGAALKGFARAVLGNADRLSQFGCPIGTLTAQLRKQPGEPGRRVGDILAGMAIWAQARFRDLGADADRARAEGRLLLVTLEGAAMMAHASGDPTFVDDTVAAIDARIDSFTDTLDQRRPS